MEKRTLVFAGIIMAIGGERKGIEEEMLIASLKEKFSEVTVDDVRYYKSELHLAGFIDFVDVEDPDEKSQIETRVWRLTGVGLKFLNLLKKQYPRTRVWRLTDVGLKFLNLLKK